MSAGNFLDRSRRKILSVSSDLNDLITLLVYNASRYASTASISTNAEHREFGHATHIESPTGVFLVGPIAAIFAVLALAIVWYYPVIKQVKRHGDTVGPGHAGPSRNDG